MNDKTAGQSFSSGLADLLKARTSLFYVVTREEIRAERLIAEAAASANYLPVIWDVAQGFTDIAGRLSPLGRETDPTQVLRIIAENQTRALYILRDLPAFLNEPVLLRSLRNLARSLPVRPLYSAAAIVILTPRSEIPPELTGAVTMLDVPLPDRAEVAAILDSVLSAVSDPKIREAAAPNGIREAAIDAASGLPETTIGQMFQRSLVKSRAINPGSIADEKRREVSKSRLLEWCDPNPAGLAAIGGLENFKAWAMMRTASFSAAARSYGLPPLKGVLTVGPPGTGKSLSAGCLSTLWNLPLLRLDVGALLSKFIGESGTNFRSALKLAESIAPCILWCDEIEKAMAGAGNNSGDAGVKSDILGALLTWSQEKTGSVFLYFTANDVSALPPEILRKGRLDEIFGLDLPTMEERSAIVAAALRKYGRSESIDLAEVAAATEGFVGARLRPPT
jgi:hypothetical protein